MARLLAIDPGGKGGDTGIVLLDYTDDTPALLVDSWAVEDDLKGFRKWFGDNGDVLMDPDTTVVCEEYVQRNVMGADLTPLLIEGAIRFMRADTVLQPASGKNTAVPDRAMWAAGFNRGMFPGDHHSDRWESLRHGLVYLKHQPHLPTLRALFPPAS